MLARFSTAALAALLLLTGCWGSASAGDNMLIGEWKRIKGDCGDEREIYTATQFSGYESPGAYYAGWRHMDVRYVASREEIWVIPLQGGATLATRAFPIDENHFKSDDMCGSTFERVG